MDEKRLADMTPEEFRREIFEGRREWLRTAPAFQCMCCHEWKDRGNAEDAHLYEPRPGPLAFRVGRRMAPVYVLCRECAEKDPEAVYQAVTASFAEAGLFGGAPTEGGRELLGRE